MGKRKISNKKKSPELDQEEQSSKRYKRHPKWGESKRACRGQIDVDTEYESWVDPEEE